MDDVFELFFGPGTRANRPVGMQGDIGWRPATDVYETEGEFIVQVDLAGMQRDHIEVWVDGPYLSIRGTRRDIAPPGKKHFHKMEIQVGPFERNIRLPDRVDPESATASYRAGFLFIRMGRGDGPGRGRRAIDIQS